MSEGGGREGGREGRRTYLQAHDGEVVVVLILNPSLGDERGREKEDQSIACLEIQAPWGGREGRREGRREGE